jgi:hypothetical protein
MTRTVYEQSFYDHCTRRECVRLDPRNTELIADFSSGRVFDLAVSRHGGTIAVRRIDVDLMPSALAVQVTTVLRQMTDQVHMLHAVRSTARVSTIAPAGA